MSWCYYACVYCTLFRYSLHCSSLLSSRTFHLSNCLLCFRRPLMSPLAPGGRSLRTIYALGEECGGARKYNLSTVTRHCRWLGLRSRLILAILPRKIIKGQEEAVLFWKVKGALTAEFCPVKTLLKAPWRRGLRSSLALVILAKNINQRPGRSSSVLESQMPSLKLSFAL